MNRRPRSSLVALTLALAAAAAPATAASAAPCSALPSPVYVAGTGSKVIAKLQAALGAGGKTVIYKLQGSCLAIDEIVNGTSITADGVTTGTYWTGTASATCDLDPKVVADLGLSDVFPTTCDNFPNGLPSNVGDFFGPVEEYSFVVPKLSSQLSISREAAYFVFGFGNGSGVDPWTDETELFVRDPNSGTQQMFGAAIGVPPTRWKGKSNTSSGVLAMSVANAPNPEGAIGVLTGEVWNTYRSSLNVLAYQDTGQSCGYWPDSTPTALDKVNVRDGHYAIWGPLHLITKLNAQGYALNATAGDLIAYLTGTKDPPMGLDLISFLAQTNLVPGCAMTVRRQSELGPLQSFTPNRACGCYFEQVATGATSCTPCTSDVGCPSDKPKCSYDYCELQ